MKIKAMLTCSVTLGALLYCSAASAQTPDNAGAGEAGAGGMGDIIVTAQKRSERLQDVPLSITAITQENLEQQGIRNIEDYASRVPGVRLSRDVTQARISIRGISSSTGSEINSATAGIFIDEYPVYDSWFRFSSPDLRIFDVERIEVLRGPQGTLYGASSLAGSVRIITAKPQMDRLAAKFEGTLSATDNGGTNYAANAMVNVPISNSVAMRAVGYVRRDSGFVDNPVQHKNNLNVGKTYGGRFYLAAEPNDTLKLLASVMYQRDEQDEAPTVYFFPPAGRGPYDWKGDLPNIIKSDLLVATVSADQEIAGGNLGITATYAKSKSNNLLDATFRAAALGVPGQPTYLSQPSDADVNLLEARYTSPSTGALKYVIGGYYSNRKRTFSQIIEQNAMIPRYGTSRIYRVFGDTKTTEYAAFGEVTWTFAQGWDATAGLRVFHNAYKLLIDISGILNSTTQPLLNFHTFSPNKATDYTPRFSLSYKPSSQVNIYTTVSKGYRFGLANYATGANPNIPLNYNSDTLWNYEAGIKTSLWGGRVTLNSSAYYIDWKNIQLSFRAPNGQTFVTNAGDARAYGLETEFTLKPNPAFELNATLTLGHAEASRDAPGVTRRARSARGPAVIGILKGDQLPGAPDISATGGIQYNFRNLGSGDGYIRVDDVYVGPSYTDFMKAGSLQIGDYNLVNLRMGYKTDRWELVGFIDNVFKSKGIVNAQQNIDLALVDGAFRVRPRTIGLTLRASY